ncbi:MAG: chorismate synthase [Thermoguttaceae bacterium]|nr:chorismate synthase [Thermoguttaceae bacterium]
MVYPEGIALFAGTKARYNFGDFSGRAEACGVEGVFPKVKIASMLRYWTAGESHGKALVALVNGFPSGVQLQTGPIDAELRRRQGGYGRGGRQRIEEDRVELLSGTWRGTTLGSPIALAITNRDYKIERMEDIDRPRPGHGDLSGALKYLAPIRAILERASARETAARVAVGALAQQLLAAFGIVAFGYVVAVGPIEIAAQSGTLAQQRVLRDASEVYSLNPDQDAEVKALIDQCQKAGDTLGGVVEVRVEGVPFGLGSHAQWDQKLDGRLAQAVMSIQAIKGVEIGLGFEAARRRGSEVHDPIRFDPGETSAPNLGFVRPTNHAGGLEAGMTNGQPIVLRAAMKPISTLARPLESVNLRTRQPESAAYERSDVCAVSAASVIVENVVAFEVARALVDKFGGDSLVEMQARWRLFCELAAEHGMAGRAES